MQYRFHTHAFAQARSPIELPMGGVPPTGGAELISLCSLRSS
jgi:hypothetical protein